MVSPMELLDRSVVYASKRLSVRGILWLVGVLAGLMLVTLFVKSDVFAGSIGVGFVLLLLVFGLGIYLLPTIKAYQDKERNKEAILVVNLLLGWTLVGWVVALVWALTKDPVSSVAAAPSVLCAFCGRYSPAGVSFCSHCGKRMA